MQRRVVLGNGGKGMTGRLIAAFTIEGEPISKARARVTTHGTYTPQRTRDAEQAVRDCYTTQTATPNIFRYDPSARFELVADFYMGNRRVKDIDNCLKLIQDGLNKLAFKDDSQIVGLHATKTFVAKDEARTEVWLYLAEEVAA